MPDKLAMSDVLSQTYDAVILVSFGGPDRPEDVVPFLRNVTAGKNIPDERLEEVGAHYALFGGKSPINEHNLALLECLGAELTARGETLPLTWGNRNWHPLIADTLAEMAGAGHQRVLAVTTSAYPSYSGCRQYGDDIAAARPGGLQVDRVGPYGLEDGFVQANLDALRAALDRLGDADPYVLFVTHSIPTSMADSSGPASCHGAGGAYLADHLAVMDALRRRLEAEDGRRIRGGDLVYCSRSGPPQVPWLEPDVNDAIEELAAAGETSVVLAPIGFISDHMEVIYDLDTEAAQTAERVGMRMARAATAGTHPAFVSMLVDRMQAAATGQIHQVDDSCCAAPRRGGRPAAART